MLLEVYRLESKNDDKCLAINSVSLVESCSEKAMAPHSSTLAWQISWTEEPGGLQSMGSWGRWESDMTERLHFHFSLSRIGEGNGNPLQCSCLENPRDRGTWWTAVSGVAQSRTRLKQLSSSCSSSRKLSLHMSSLFSLENHIGQSSSKKPFQSFSFQAFQQLKDTHIALYCSELFLCVVLSY